MKRKILIALAFGIEHWKALSGHDVALEATDLTFVQELLAHRVLAAGVGARSWCTYEFFAIEFREEIRGLSFKTVAFGFAGTGHCYLISQFHSRLPLIFETSS